MKTAEPEQPHPQSSPKPIPPGWWWWSDQFQEGYELPTSRDPRKPVWVRNPQGPVWDRVRELAATTFATAFARFGVSSPGQWMIAGGSVKRLYFQATGRPVSNSVSSDVAKPEDVDVFFLTKEALDSWVTPYQANDKGIYPSLGASASQRVLSPSITEEVQEQWCLSEHKAVETQCSSVKWDLVLRSEKFRTPEAILEDFDMENSQVGILSDGTVLVSEGFIESVDQGILALTERGCRDLSNSERDLKLLSRLVRYAETFGYRRFSHPMEMAVASIRANYYRSSLWLDPEVFVVAALCGSKDPDDLPHVILPLPDWASTLEVRWLRPHPLQQLVARLLFRGWHLSSELVNKPEETQNYVNAVLRHWGQENNVYMAFMKRGLL